MLYGIKDKEACLNELAKLAEPETILAIFDYSVKSNPHFPMTDLADREMHPINLTKLPKSNWEWIEKIDISKEYMRWYREFLLKLSNKKQELLNTFSENIYQKVFDTFSKLLQQLEEDNIGGVILICKYTVR